jgi:hypothetical protein
MIEKVIQFRFLNIKTAKHTLDYDLMYDFMYDKFTLLFLLVPIRIMTSLNLKRF